MRVSKENLPEDQLKTKCSIIIENLRQLKNSDGFKSLCELYELNDIDEMMERTQEPVTDLALHNRRADALRLMKGFLVAPDAFIDQISGIFTKKEDGEDLDPYERTPVPSEK